MSSFNCSTLSGGWRRNELAAFAERMHIDVLGIQEHKLRHVEPLRALRLSPRWTLHLGSADEHGQGGVGALLGPRAQQALNRTERVSPRILALHFACAGSPTGRGAPASAWPKVVVIVCYSPHAATTADDPTPVQDFYRDLSAYMDGIGRHAFVCLLGDWNARLGLGTADAPWVHDDTPNANAPFFTDFLQRHQLFSANATFQKRRGKLWTHESNGRRSQLDHLVFRRRYRHSVDNAEAYSLKPFASDHRPVTATLRLRLRASVVARPPARPLWQALGDPAHRARFDEALTNRLAADSLLAEFPPPAAAATPCPAYSGFVAAVAHAATSLPRAPRVRRATPWVDERVVARRQELRRAQRAHRRHRTAASQAAATAAAKALADQYAANQTELAEATIAQIEQAADRGRTHEVWAGIDALTGRKAIPRPQIPAESPAARLAGWRQYFQQLLNQPPTHPFRPHASVVIPAPSSPYQTGDITLQEVEAAAKATPLRKACGADGVPPDVLRLPSVQRHLLPILQAVYRTGAPPAEFLRNKIIPLPKSGDTTRYANYRGITLMSCVAKLYDRILLHRLRGPLESILHTHQHGFRPGCGTAEPVLALRRAIEELTRHRNRGLVVVFVDFLKAFDSVSREALFQLLPLYGIPAELITAIRCIYDGSTSFVSTLDGDSECFPVTTGVLQGDTLAPLLFIIALDYALRVMRAEAPDCGLRVPGGDPISDLDYADDVALLGIDDTQVQRLFAALEVAAANVGLRINFAKSKALRLGHPGGVAAPIVVQAAPPPVRVPPPPPPQVRPVRGPMDRFVIRTRSAVAAAAATVSMTTASGTSAATTRAAAAATGVTAAATGVTAAATSTVTAAAAPAATTATAAPRRPATLRAGSGELELVADFSYLGSKMCSLPDELQMRIALAWKATDRLWRLWKSGLSVALKRRLFHVTVTPVLLHGGECWPLRVHDEQLLDGAYTRLLRKALNVSWRSYTPNVDLYGDLLPPSVLLRQRRIRFAGHCSRRQGWPVARLLWWKPTATLLRGGHTRMTYVRRLEQDTGRAATQLRELANNRDSWRTLIFAGADA
jgi:exonuclease III